MRGLAVAPAVLRRWLAGIPGASKRFWDLLSRQRGNAGCQVLGPVAGGFDGPALRRHLAGGCQRENSRVGNRMSDAIMSSGHACQ